MKRNFVVGMFGGLIGSAMLLLVLSAAGIVGARSADVTRSDVARANDVSAATPLTSTFTYQGQLINSGSPVSSACGFQFGLWDSASGLAQIGLTQTVSSVSVSRGLFTALLNTGNEFGGTAFNGDARWLQIAVRCPDSGSYTAMSTRQQLTSLPFALPGLRTFPNATSPNIIGGYIGNFISSTVVGSVIGGGGDSSSSNLVQSSYATIGGGFSNTASGYNATIGGGDNNKASEQDATVGGGWGNTASSENDTIGGGNNNLASGGNATVGGGDHNTASGGYATVGGGLRNSADGGNGGYYATVGGGYSNHASEENATVSGGEANWAVGRNSTVGGGNGNFASAEYATIGGGGTNTASGPGAFVGGGGYDGTNYGGNQATGNASTIGGGISNTASAYAATVGGGYGNTGGYLYATVPGGYYNTAVGNFSFAAGRQAKANHQGAFVWADSTNADINSSADNQFIVRANGGIWLGKSTSNFTPTIGAGVFISTSTGAKLTTTGVWTDLSDRNAKENFLAVNGRDVLAKLIAMPVSIWNYKVDDASIRHIGPTAQDFYSTFGVGNDDTHLAALDTNGVALAAIQGLYQENQDLKSQNADLIVRVSKLEQNATASNPSAQTEPFNVSTLLSVIALIAVGWLGLQQRRSKRGEL